MLGTTDGRPTLTLRRRLAHPADKVWQALTEPKELSQWYPFQATGIDLRVGGTIDFEDEAGNTYDSVITELEPKHLLVFQLAQPNIPGGRESDNQLRFELRPDPPHGCLLIFTHTFADRPAAASYAAGWQFCLGAMESLLTGDPITHPTPAAMRAAHETYIESFGLNQGTIEPTGNAWHIRFERQFMMVEAPAVSAALAAEDGVHWQLSEGPGGARLELTVRGHPDQDPQAAQALWQERINSLARRPVGA